MFGKIRPSSRYLVLLPRMEFKDNNWSVLTCSLLIFTCASEEVGPSARYAGQASQLTHPFLRKIL